MTNKIRIAMDRDGPRRLTNGGEGGIITGIEITNGNDEMPETPTFNPTPDHACPPDKLTTTNTPTAPELLALQDQGAILTEEDEAKIKAYRQSTAVAAGERHE